VRFFVGLHKPWQAEHFDAAFVSVNTLRSRKSAFPANEWIMDSGAFTELKRFGGYRHSVEEYAAEIRRWSKNGTLLAAVAQDWMCEDVVIQGDTAKGFVGTGLSRAEHQRLTIDRYDALLACDTAGVYIMPVLQGYEPHEYVEHIRQYGERLTPGMWVGVGSVCKRNGDPRAIEAVLLAIHRERPDLRLHGFGLKTTALSSGIVRRLLHTADSMAWSYNARRNGRNANDWREAARWVAKIENQRVQWPLFLARAA
jgi:hypothetical protein